MKKKHYIIYITLLIIFLFSGCSKTYTPPDLSKLTPEQQKQLQKFQDETLGNLSEDEMKELHDKYDYIAAIARDISKKYIVSDNIDYEYLTIKNMGDFLQDDITFTRIDLMADDTYVKSILISVETETYKLYDKTSKKIEDFDYNPVGHFVRNLGPWVSIDQKLLSIDGSTPQRTGTSAEIYRDPDNTFMISIQTYYGFDNIATIYAPLILNGDKEAQFSFQNDGYGFSGSGKIKYISEEEMILEITSNKPENNFGLATGTHNLVRNKM